MKTVPIFIYVMFFHLFIYALSLSVDDLRELIRYYLVRTIVEFNIPIVPKENRESNGEIFAPRWGSGQEQQLIISSEHTISRRYRGENIWETVLKQAGK